MSKVWIEPTGDPQVLEDGRVAAIGAPVDVEPELAALLESRGTWQIVPWPQLPLPGPPKPTELELE